MNKTTPRVVILDHSDVRTLRRLADFFMARSTLRGWIAHGACRGIAKFVTALADAIEIRGSASSDERPTTGQPLVSKSA